MQEKEKRLFRRVRKNLHVQCHAHNTAQPWVSAIVQDIGEAGASIATVKAFPIDQVLEIRITTFLRRSSPLSILGRVVSNEEKKTGATNWLAHIAFTSILEEDKSILKEVVQAFLETSNKEQEK